MPPRRQPDISWTSAATCLIYGSADNYRQKFTMKFLIWGLQIAGICSSLLPTVCAARDDGLHLKVTGKRNPPNSRHSKRGNIIGSSTLSNAGDISYYTNITLGGGSFSVLIGVCDPLPLRLMLNSNTLDTGRYICRVSKREQKNTDCPNTSHVQLRSLGRWLRPRSDGNGEKFRR